jgi:hypothetical protein
MMSDPTGGRSMFRFVALSVLVTSLSLSSGLARAQSAEEMPSMIIAGECAPLYSQIVRYQYSFFNLTGTRLITEWAINNCGGPRHTEAYADMLEAAYRSQVKVP